VVKYSRLPARTLLKDVEKLRPLHDIIFRFFRFLPISNFFSETVVKTLVKTLHPTQRREEATASRWVAALHRDPSRLARLTDALVQWARGVLKTSKDRSRQQQVEVPAIDMHGSILGTASELDVPAVIAHDSLGDKGSDGKADHDLEDEQEEEEEEAEAVRDVIASSGAADQEHIEYVQKKLDGVRSGLLVGKIVLVGWGDLNGFFMAEVAEFSKAPKAYTFQALWFDEVEPGIYEKDARWPKASARMKDVFELNPSVEKLTDGRVRLLNVLQPTGQPVMASDEPSEKPMIKEPASKKSAVVVKLFVAKPKASGSASSTATSIAAKPAPTKSPAALSASKLPTAGESTPQTAHSFLHAADKLLRGAGKLRSDRPILTRSNSEWLNDVQIANHDKLNSRAHLKLLYPKSVHLMVALLDKRTTAGQRFLKLVDMPVRELPTANFSQVQPCAVDELHWHTFMFCFQEKSCYAFDGFCNDIPETITSQFAAVMAPHGWHLCKIQLRLQFDSCSCGVWIQVARDAFAEYTESAQCGTKSFPAYFKDWLARRGVGNLDDYQGVPGRKVGNANNKFILEQRAEMRELLVLLAIEGKLAYDQALLPGFSSNQATVPDDDDCFVIEKDNDCFIVDKPTTC
jgi:hypothetical protein